MARPKKNNADYFSHDSDMRNDPKIKAIRRTFGFKGYAIWCYFLETLTDADFFEIEWNDLSIELLSGDFDCTPEELKELVDYLLKLGLLNIVNDYLFSPKLKERFEGLLSKRSRDIKHLSVAKTQNKGVIDAENPQSKVKESKVKESKVKKKDLSPFELIQKEKPSELESWKMQNLKSVHDFNSLVDSFNDSALLEIMSESNLLKLQSDMLIIRFRKYARSWIANQKGGKVLQIETPHDPDYIYFTTNTNKTANRCHRDKWEAYKANEEQGGRILTVVEQPKQATYAN